MASIYDRALFGGQPPVPDSVGVGITSGLADPAAQAPMQDGAAMMENQMEGEGSMAVAAGLQSAAEGLETMFGELDQAEDIEEVINALRGDEKPITARYEELATLVGREDAQQTPESVLAILQPTFQIMETLQQNAPEGGIANAPMNMGGEQEDTINFSGASSVQAPRMEEAMARIAMGEQPMGFADGTDEGGISIPGIVTPFNPETPVLNTSSSKAYPTVNIRNDFAYTTDTAFPSLQSTPKMETARNVMSDYMTLMTPYLQGGGSGDANTLGAANMKTLDPYLTKPRTKEEILAEQQGFFGDDTQADAEIQALLALAKYGSKVSQTPGSLLQALVTPAGDFATDLSKVAATKSAAERKAKEFAYNTAAAEKEAERTQKLSIMQNAINTAASNASSSANALRSVASEAAKLGLTFAKDEQAIVNKMTEMAWTANNQYGVLGTETWVKQKDDGGYEAPISVRRTPDGPKYWNNGRLEKIPEGYFQADASTLKVLGATGGLDTTSASRVNLLVPDKTSLSGYTQTAGFFLNGSYYYNPDGSGSTNGAVPAPRGFIVGEEKDILQVAEPDSVGRIFATYKSGPNAGKSILTGIVGQDGEAKVIEGVAHELVEPVYETKPDGSRVLLRGNPMVENAGKSGLNYANMTPNQVENAQRKVADMTAALNQGNELLAAIPQAVGPLNSIKSFASNNIAMFVPDSWSSFTEFAGTERGRQQMQLFGRTLARAAALSDRYAVAEQQLITQLAEDPSGFFKNPDMSAVRFQELMRTLQNELAENRALLGDTDILRVRAVPTGTVNDPFLYSAPGHFEYLTISGANGANLDGMVLRMTAQEARNAGVPNTVIGNQGIVDLRLKTGPNGQVQISTGN